jgi:hypothetical protein
MSKRTRRLIQLLTVLIFLSALSAVCSQASAQDTSLTVKAVLAEWKGKEVWFNDGTPPCKLTELYADHFQCRFDVFTYYIPYGAIVKIERVGGKKPMLKIYLMTHVSK